MGDEIEVCTAEPVGGDGLINPDAFPCRAYNLNTSDITGAAADLRAMGTAVETETSSIDTTWSGLTAHYKAPEQDQVYALMDPAVSSAEDLKTALHSAAGYLDVYAGELDGIYQTLWDFVGTAAAFRREVEGGVYVDASEAKDASFGDMVVGAGDWIPGVDEEQVLVPWYEDSATVDRNRELLEEYGGILAQINAAATACANGINGLVTNMCMAPLEAIPAEAFSSPEMPMPWGYARDEDRNCPESVGHGVSNFGYGMYSGAASLIGYDTEAGEWGWDVAGQAWGGLGNFLGSTLVLVTFTPHLAQLGVPMPEGVRDWLIERGDVAAGGLSSLVSYDYYAMLDGGDGWHRWKEDGVAAGTEAVLNIGTFFIPGAGQVGAALKTGSIGARLMRVAGVVSDFVVPGGSFAVHGGVSVLSGLRTALRFGDDVPAGLGGGVRFNPAALIDDVTDLPTPPIERTSPVSTDLFGGNGPDGLPGRPDVAPGADLGGADGVPGRPDVSVDQPGAGGAPESPGAGGAPEQPGAGGAPEQPGAGTPEATPSNGTRPSDGRPTTPYDPGTSAPETIPAKDAPQGYTPEQVQQALDEAPVNSHGDPVDPRTGEPLLLERSDGNRGWEMRWDAEHERWVAQNHGSGESGGLAPTGEPNSFGYDADGNRLPYANHRPDYAVDQVEQVFENTHDAQVSRAEAGLLVDENQSPLPAPGDNQVWVQHVDDTWHLITWEPGQPRDGLWDMGHLPGAKYSSLREQYLSGEISTAEFLEEYRDPENYVAQDPGRNQSHLDE